MIHHCSMLEQSHLQCLLRFILHFQLLAMGYHIASCFLFYSGSFYNPLIGCSQSLQSKNKTVSKFSFENDKYICTMYIVCRMHIQHNLQKNLHHHNVSNDIHISEALFDCWYMYFLLINEHNDISWWRKGFSKHYSSLEYSNIIRYHSWKHVFR